MSNLLEVRSGIVHADSGNGFDYTLCGITAYLLIADKSGYDPAYESPWLPVMLKTDRKINCPQCAATIRYCCQLGLKSISKDKKDSEA